MTRELIKVTKGTRVLVIRRFSKHLWPGLTLPAPPYCDSHRNREHTTGPESDLRPPIHPGHNDPQTWPPDNANSNNFCLIMPPFIIVISVWLFD